MLRALALGLAIIAASLTVTGKARSQGTEEINLEQARQLAVYALRSGDPGLAIQVSRGLLQADPRDPVAYFVIAQAHAGLNQPNLGRRAAARAYRYSDTETDRFQAAQLAARMAYREGRLSLAQVWLRRTAQYAPGEREEAAVARDYRVLRAINPWAFRLSADLRPSSNVNNGADTALNLIDGTPDGGSIPVAGRALSGLIGSLDISSSYRLRANQNSRTSLGGRLYIQRVALSAAAKDLLTSGPSIPGQTPVRNSDFASTYAEVSLRHAFAVGDEEQGGSAVVELAVGESWYGQERSYRFSRLRAERTWNPGQKATRVTLSAMAENRNKARYSTNEAQILGLGAEVQRRLGNGDQIGLTIALRDTNAASRNGTFSSASMRTSYKFAKPIGPAKLSAGLVLGYSDYPSFIFTIPPRVLRRQDKSIYGDISLFFDKYDYAGFAPVLRFRAGRKTSNFSRFESRELSVSLSIRSKF
jgi:hypothetical protein